MKNIDKLAILALVFAIAAAVAVAGLLFSEPEVKMNGYTATYATSTYAFPVVKEAATRCRDPKTGRFAKCP